MELLNIFGENDNEFVPTKELELEDTKNQKKKSRCKDFIFPAGFNSTDITEIEKRVSNELQNFVGILNLYDTGNPVELLAVTKYCFTHEISLVVWHYDENKSSYFPQMM